MCYSTALRKKREKIEKRLHDELGVEFGIHTFLSFKRLYPWEFIHY